MVDDTSDRRTNDQWIRDALKEHKQELAAIHKEQKDDSAATRKEIAAIHKELLDFVGCALSAIPNKDPKAHLTAHEQWRLEKEERAIREEQDAKLRLEVRNGLIKTAVNAAILFIGGILLLGAQAQFGLWVVNVKPTPVVAVETDKQGGK